jgi:hypothetical protein
LLYEYLPVTSEIKRPPASELRKLALAAQKITGEIVEWSFKKCCITNTHDGTENDTLWHSSDLDSSDLKSDLEEFVDSVCETDAQMKKTVNR